MRVCMVTPHLPPEQSANAILPATLGAALEPRGVRCEYVSHPPPPASVRVARATYVPKRGRDAFSRTTPGAVIAGTRMALGARPVIRTSDLVHLHSNGFLIEVGQWLAQRYRKPYVATLYGTDISAYDPSRNARFGAVVRNAASRVFYSRGLLKQAERAGLAPNPSTVIYAPVSADFEPADDVARRSIRRELGVGDERLLLTVKRLHAVAGHDMLLAAFAKLRERIPGVRLWLAGDGEQQPTLEKMCHDLGIASQVRFLGRIDNASLRQYYAAADLFVLPSRVESWGTVMLESLACGTPVVTTDTVGGAEVRDNFPEDVTVVSKDDPDAMATAVWHQLSRRIRTTASAVQRIRTCFSVEYCAARYLEVYEEVLGSGGKVRR